MQWHKLHCIGVRKHHITSECVHGTDLALHLVLNHVGLGMGRSQIEFHSVKRKWKMKCVGRSK